MYKCVMFAIIDFWLVPTFVILADGRPRTWALARVLLARQQVARRE